MQRPILATIAVVLPSLGVCSALAWVLLEPDRAPVASAAPPVASNSAPALLSEPIPPLPPPLHIGENLAGDFRRPRWPDPRNVFAFGRFSKCSTRVEAEFTAGPGKARLRALDGTYACDLDTGETTLREGSRIRFEYDVWVVVLIDRERATVLIENPVNRSQYTIDG